MRHAKPLLPHGGKVYYGSTDCPLSDEGREQATAAALALAGLPQPARCYTSDMERARDTAKIIFPNAPITEVAGLREINLGEWEMKTYDEVKTQFAEIYEARGVRFDSTAPPGGETFREVQARAVPAFEKILRGSPAEDIFIVAHGAVIWTIMSHYFKFDLNDMFFFPQDHCGIHVIKESCDRKRLVKYNWTPKLI